jgi:hypothetical protein
MRSGTGRCLARILWGVLGLAIFQGGIDSQIAGTNSSNSTSTRYRSALSPEVLHAWTGGLQRR